MSANPLKQGALVENSTGIGTVSRQMIKERAMELAEINGHSARDVSKTEWEQAKRELTGEPDMAPKEAVLESAPESERWDPIRGSIGHMKEEAGSEDEDEEGHSDSARLVEEGVKEADHQQMLQAARTQRNEKA
jgi:hypothetical protein